MTINQILDMLVEERIELELAIRNSSASSEEASVEDTVTLARLELLIDLCAPERIEEEERKLSARRTEEREDREPVLDDDDPF